MNVEDMSVAIWEQLGEPNDLVPGTLDTNGNLTYSSGSTGGTKLLGWINRAVSRILSWKTKQGRIIRFRDLDERVFFQGFEETGTAQSGTSTTITLDPTASTTDDKYNGMVVEITGGTGEDQTRLITDYNGTTLNATPSKDWSTTPDNTSTYAINKAFYRFRESTDADVGDNILVDGKDKILTVTKVKDLKSEADLQYREKTEAFVGSADEVGTPSMWWIEGNGIRFDVAPDEDRWYEAHLRVLPEDTSTGTDVVQIPETFQEAVVMWCVWYGLLRDRDYTGAYAMHRNLETFMDTTVSEQDLLTEEMDGGVQIYGYDYY